MRPALALCLVALPAAALDSPNVSVKVDEKGLSVTEAAPRKINVEVRGSLRDALNRIAKQGGINLVATGSLDEPVEVVLNGVTAEEALETIAQAYSLKLQKSGRIWTARPMTGEEREDAAEAAAEKPDDKDDDADEDGRAEAVGIPDPPNRPDMKEVLEEKLEARAGDRDGDDRVANGSVTIAAGETVDDAVAFGGSLDVQGHVRGDAVAFGGSVTLGDAAVVEGDAVAFGGSVQKMAGAKIGGDQVSFGAGDFGRTIAAAVGSMPLDLKDKDGAPRRIRKDLGGSRGGVPGFLLRFAMLFGLGFLFILFAPQRMRQIEAELKADAVKCGLTGLLGLAVMVPLTVVLMITVIGIPFAVVLWIGAALGAAMGVAAVASEIGLRLPLFRGRKTQAIVLALGLVVMLAAGQIPVVGPLLLTCVSLAALGAIIRTRFGSRPNGIPEPIEPSRSAPIA